MTSKTLTVQLSELQHCEGRAARRVYLSDSTLKSLGCVAATRPSYDRRWTEEMRAPLKATLLAPLVGCTRRARLIPSPLFHTLVPSTCHRPSKLACLLFFVNAWS